MATVAEPRIITDPEEKAALLARIQEERTVDSRNRIAAREAILPSPLPTGRVSRGEGVDMASILTKGIPGSKVITDPKEKQRFIDIANADPGSLQGAFFGLRTGAGLVEAGAEALINSNFANFAFAAINQGTLNPDVIPELQETPESARELTKQRVFTAPLVNEAIAARPDLQEKRAFSIAVGNVAAAVGDPTSILPLAPLANIAKGRAAYVSAAAVGAGLGAADMATFQQAREGEIDPTAVRNGAMLGAALGPLMVFGLRRFSSLKERIRDRQLNDQPLDSNEVQALLEDGRPSALLPPPPRQGTLVGGPFEDIIIRGQGPVKPPEALPARVIEGEFTVEEVVETVAEAARKEQETSLGLRDWVAVTRALNQSLGLPKGLEMPSAVNAGTWPEIAEGGAFRHELAVRNKANNQPVPAEPVPKNKTPIPRKEWDRVIEQQSDEAITTFDDLLENDLKAVRAQIGELNKQGGFANTQLMSAIAGGGIGFTVSGGDPEWAFWGAALGGGLPYGAGLVRRIGTQSMKEDPLTGFHLLRFSGFGTPIKIIRNHLGEAGRRFADNMEKAQINAELATADRIWSMDSIARAARASGISSERIKRAELEAMELLQKTRKLDKASPAAKRIANTWRKVLNRQLDEAVKVGIMKPEVAAKLKARAIAKGYFPRVYNEAFLTTKEGKDKWMEVFTKQGFQRDTAERMIKSIINDEDEAASVIKELKTKKGSSQVFISEALAKRMYELRRKGRETARSGHLELRRGIHVPTEDILRPFLLPDARAAMLQYFDETNRRIEYARLFGANDENALRELGQINNEFGNSAARKAGEIYWQRVGDSRSDQIRYAAQMSDFKRELFGRVNAFETLKLSMAQMLNAGQAITNGTILAARLSGGNPFKSLKLLTDIAGDLKTNPGKFQETAQRSGAALETTLMQTIGEWASVNHRIAGREFTGVLSPLEWVNNPTKFLEGTGFVAVEKFQRNLAANMGRAYAEEVTESLEKMRQAGDTSSKAFRRRQREARELGLDPNKAVYQERDMLDASLRWSNMVNFRNTPGNMPLAWTHPNATWFKKFKTFAFNHASFLMDNIVKPAVDQERTLIERGTTVAGTTLGLAGAAAVIGVPVSSFRALVKGDDADLTNTEKFIRGFTAIGGAGIWYDTINSFNPVESFLGPVASDAGTIAREMKGLASGKDGPSKTAFDIIRGTMSLPKEKDLKELIERNFE